MNETIKKNLNSTVKRVVIDEASEAQRLDNFLIRTCKGVPKTHIYRIIRNGEVRVNKSRAKVSTRLHIGDVVRIPPIRVSASQEGVVKPSSKALAIQLPILYEDNFFLAINKPAGLAVHGGSGVSFGVIELLRAQRPEARFLELVHRLDRDTSGILLVAKKRSALRKLNEFMREGDFDKHYLAIAVGKMHNTRQHVKLPLQTHLMPSGERRVKVNKDDGKPAHTIFNRMETAKTDTGSYVLVEAELKTGRTHQIRVHLAALGTPVLGDDKYGNFPVNHQWEKQGHNTMCLHAWKLSFPHPSTHEEQTVIAPVPDEFNRYWETISGHAVDSHL